MVLMRRRVLPVLGGFALGIILHLLLSFSDPAPGSSEMFHRALTIVLFAGGAVILGFFFPSAPYAGPAGMLAGPALTSLAQAATSARSSGQYPMIHAVLSTAIPAIGVVAGMFVNRARFRLASRRQKRA